jgi:hypothetical protein
MESEEMRYGNLRLLVATFTDLQRARIRIQNRKTAYEDRNTLVVGGTDLVLQGIYTLEQDADADLVRSYLRTVDPKLIAWQQGTPGIGEHQMALLLGLVGDPLMAYPKKVVKVEEGKRKRETGRRVNNTVPDGEPYIRSVASLRAYCGFGAPLRRRRASDDQPGMTGDEAKALGNTRAKVVVWNMTKSVIMHRNPKYRLIYDEAKEAKQNASEPWRPAHIDAHAYRLVAKAIIKDIWVAAGGEPEPPPVKKTTKVVKKVAKRKAAA